MANVESHVGEVLSALDVSTYRALETIGLVAERYAKKKCPVDTGRLRNSITHETDSDTVYVGTNVEYASYVELGTHRQRAKPYLKPAMVDHKKEYERILRDELGGGFTIG